jgi:aryl-alcohol dehydrogenase-like predicted oxidoreductase
MIVEYVRLGASGLKVSRICFGCLGFGNEQDWMVEQDVAQPVIKKALDLGVNFFDTANVYSHGRSEEITGTLLHDVRDDVVIATKVYGLMGKGPNQRGLSRKHILHQVNASLQRLGTSYIDLYQIHRWDYETPITETLSTLNDQVRQGSVRYIGASSMWAWQLMYALSISDQQGYSRFISMQNLYNLLYREEEREMIPLCRHEKISLIPWSPLAVGVLSGKYLKKGKLVITDSDIGRLQPDQQSYQRYIVPPENAVIVQRVVDIAITHGVTPVQIALAWLFQKDVIPIVGTTNPDHIVEAVDALTITLSDDEMRRLEELYLPKPVTGHS